LVQPVKLTIPSDPKYLCLLRKVLQHLFCSHEVSEELASRLVLCIDEACSNVIKYSYNGRKDQPIDISFFFEADSFIVKIHDYGKQCNTKEFTPRSLEDVKPGGLGTHFMKEIMDEVSYCTDRDKGTLLTMTKKLKGHLHTARRGGKEKK
jgi:anti-sigma regulatory factor (Ser/Thr protein kinase)